MNIKFTIGIIGGNGGMGKALKNFFSRNSLNVLTSDIGSELKNKELAEESDIVILSVPLCEYENVLKDIYASLKSNGTKLLMDIGSLKSKQTQLMKKFFKGPVLPVHPLFGPDKNFASGNTIIFCNENTENDKIKFMENIFIKNGLKTVKMSPKEHDELMSYIHSFYYFINIAYLKLLNKKFGKIEDIDKFATASFQNFKDNLKNIFNTPSWLIETIIFENPFLNERKKDFIDILNTDSNANKELIEEVIKFAKNHKN